MDRIEQTHLKGNEEGMVFTYCGRSYGMESLSHSVQTLVAGEMTHHPQRDFLSNAHEALRGNRAIVTSRHLADQALYSVASRQQSSRPSSQIEEL